MITAITIGVVALALIGLLSAMFYVAINRADELGHARADAAKLEGLVAAASAETNAANAAAQELDAARLRQLARANALEGELNEAESNPMVLADGRSGRERLRQALSDTASDRGTRGHGSLDVPDRPSSAGPVGDPGVAQDGPVTKPE